ncbi:EamA family transporter [Clostridium sp. MB40-C1]|uniref:DMT family transporter n=1 Tax=Clostridium sp. MB40-C1 TaxID=3070996 RepID=UPI0027DF82B6|nr:EamA family transporter [Clostridium sp. MB40-C1]WMJ80417.1 EamA family transporter [Clostridium sp. MB40-C1]
MGYLFIIIPMLIWGSVGIFVRYINQPPEVIVFCRVFIAFIIMLLLSIIKMRRKNPIQIRFGKRDNILLLLSGVFISFNWMFFFKALKSTTIASATLSYYAAPVIVTILSVFILKEKISKRTFFAVGLSFIGIILMTLSGDGTSNNFNIIGVIYGLIAAFFYALVTISAKKMEHIPSYKIVMVQMGVASLILSPSISQVKKFDTISLVFIFIIGAVHSFLALQLYFEGLKKVKVQHVGVLSYIDPLSAVILACIFFGEVPGYETLIGGTMILIATYIILNVKKQVNISDDV